MRVSESLASPVPGRFPSIFCVAVVLLVSVASTTAAGATSKRPRRPPPKFSRAGRIAKPLPAPAAKPRRQTPIGESDNPKLTLAIVQPPKPPLTRPVAVDDSTVPADTRKEPTPALPPVTGSGGHQYLTNQHIIKMRQAGVPDSMLRTFIKQNPGNYRFDPPSFKHLLDEGVPEEVYREMFVAMLPPQPNPKDPPRSNPTVPLCSPAENKAEPPLKPVPGPVAGQDEKLFYAGPSGSLVEVQKEPVAWSVKRALQEVKRTLALRLAGRRFEGKLAGRASHAFVSNPVRLVLAAARGDLHRYQIVRFEADSRRREVVVGPLMTGPSEQKRTLLSSSIPFSAEATSQTGVYEIRFQDRLPRGEYGLLDVTTVAPDNKPNKDASIHTFRVTD